MMKQYVYDPSIIKNGHHQVKENISKSKTNKTNELASAGEGPGGGATLTGDNSGALCNR